MSDSELMNGIRDYLNAQAGGPPNPPAAPSEPNPKAGDTADRRAMDAVQQHLERQRRSLQGMP